MNAIVKELFIPTVYPPLPKALECVGNGCPAERHITSVDSFETSGLVVLRIHADIVSAPGTRFVIVVDGEDSVEWSKFSPAQRRKLGPEHAEGCSRMRIAGFIAIPKEKILTPVQSSHFVFRGATPLVLVDIQTKKPRGVPRRIAYAERV